MLKEETKEIKLNRKPTHCIRFVEDIALVTDLIENITKFIKCP